MSPTVVPHHEPVYPSAVSLDFITSAYPVVPSDFGWKASRLRHPSGSQSAVQDPLTLVTGSP